MRMFHKLFNSLQYKGRKGILVLLLLIAGTTVAQEPVVPDANTQRIREEFQDRKFGIFLHWGIYSMMADGEWVMYNKRISKQEYPRLANGFYPSKFDANEWTKLFKEAGAQYITFTSRHHDGFSMWNSKASDYNIVKATPFGRDVLKELADACAKNQLKMHLYYSHMDWIRDDYPLGSTSKALPHDESTTNWESYYRFMNDQLTELLTNYGPIGAIWFDGVWDHKETGFDWQLPEQYALIKRLQPNCMIGNNHHGSPIDREDFQLFEQDLPGQNTAGFSGNQKVSQALPLETCLTMNNTWGYSITDKNYKSAEDLIRKLVTAAGLNANFLLNIGPRPDGTLPSEAVERLQKIGEFMKLYGKSIYKTRGGCIAPQSWGVTTQRDNTLYIHILNKTEEPFVLPADIKIRKIVTFENNEKIKFKKDKDGYHLTLPERGDRIDQILVAELQ